MSFPILGPLLDLAGGWVKGLSERKLAEVKAKTETVLDTIRTDNEVRILLAKAKVAQAEKAQTAEIDWDQLWAKQAETSWKDEVVTIVILAPVVLLFIPGMQPYVMKGFDALAELPDWFQLAIGAVIAVSFGLRTILDRFMPARKTPAGQSTKGTTNG